MKHRTTITLELVYDPQDYTNPAFWEWESLLSLDDDELLEVTIRNHETEVIETAYAVQKDAPVRRQRRAADELPESDVLYGESPDY